jgi:hypothetical protein
MIRWVAVIFLGLAVFYPLLPFMARLGVGRVPGDVLFKLRGVILCLPFGSTLLWAVLAFLIARFVHAS